MKSAVIIFLSRQDDTRRVSFTGAQIADSNFRVSAASGMQSRA
jgi:hypothetical protein